MYESFSVGMTKLRLTRDSAGYTVWLCQSVLHCIDASVIDRYMECTVASVAPERDGCRASFYVGLI